MQRATRLLPAVLLFTLLAFPASVAWADQVKRVSESNARAAKTLFERASAVRHFCAPCGDGTYTEEDVGTVAFDIKTTLEEKADLTAVKHAVIEAVESAEWAEVTEVGEDYSLWITGARRWQRGNQRHGAVVLELRTPAMLSRGEYVNRRQIRFQFDRQQVQEVARRRGSALQQRANEVAASCGSAQKLLSAVASFQGIDMGVLTSQVDICAFVSGLYRSVQPSPVDLVEASEVARKTLRATRAMLKPRTQGRRR